MHSVPAKNAGFLSPLLRPALRVVNESGFHSSPLSTPSATMTSVLNAAAPEGASGKWPYYHAQNP